MACWNCTIEKKTVLRARLLQSFDDAELQTGSQMERRRGCLSRELGLCTGADASNINRLTYGFFDRLHPALHLSELKRNNDFANIVRLNLLYCVPFRRSLRSKIADAEFVSLLVSSGFSTAHVMLLK
jgi:hypothetical protein